MFKHCLPLVLLAGLLMSLTLVVSPVRVVAHSDAWGDGQQWYVQSRIPKGSTVSDAVFVDSNDGWVIGTNGGLFHTVDGGQTWIIKSTGTTKELDRIAFVDAQHGYAIGGAVLLSTSDAGATWHAEPLSIGHGVVTSLSVVSDTTLYITFASSNTLYGSKDGGATWYALGAGSLAQFESADSGWLANGGKLYHTTDGANTWSLVLNIEKILAIAIPSPGKIVLSTSGGIYRSQDDGADWSHFPLAGLFTTFAFASPSQGFAADQQCLNFYYYTNPIYATSDGGATWRPLSLPNDPAYHPNSNNNYPLVSCVVGYRDASHPFVIAKSNNVANPNTYFLSYGSPPLPTPTATDIPMPTDTPVPPAVATDTPTPQDTPVTVMGLTGADPSTVIAQSGDQFTISGAGFDEEATVSIGDHDLSADDVQFMTSDDGDSLEVTLPNRIKPGVYDITVTEPDGTSATLAQALTVLRRLTLAVHQQERTVHPGGSVAFQVSTLAGAILRVHVFAQQRHARPHAKVTIVSQRRGTWRVTVTIGKHDPLGKWHVVVEARLGEQVEQQIGFFQVVRR